jgi:cyclophilin family peptidyl-prolyl cis-trans isomerase
MTLARILLVAFALAPAALAQQPAAEDYSKLEALVQTSKGDITFRFFPADAPRHVEHFVETARKGGYDGTVFHRAIAYAIVQGGDPLSKDPKKKALYGTGGLKLLPDEVGTQKHLAGAVSAVMLPGPGGNPIPGSSGTQFFFCDTPQPALDGKYSVFGRVTEGMDVVRAISIAPAANGMLAERVEIKKVTIRPITPSDEELEQVRARIETDAGEIVWEFLPTAPENARSFVQHARAGMYDNATIYRAVAGQLMQGAQPDPAARKSYSVWPLPDEFTTSVEMDRGVVGMAHGDQANSATIHWFVLTKRAPHLDGKYTAFARVVSGMDVVDAISNRPTTGDALQTPVVVKKVTIEPK